ncbi:MAG: hypothetical protein GC149_08925 [Gammaproteobacteria bacterium]|nr:hypothetical protein [Gammaproteobacteria bacterium]
MKSLFVRISLIAGFLLPFQLAWSDVHFLLEAGVHTGGDELIHVTFSDGSTASIKGGSLVTLGAGLAANITDKLELRFVENYKADSVNASNGSIDFTRWVSNLLLLYRVDKWKLGGGLTHHRNIKLKGDGVASVLNVNFDDAVGTVLEADYQFGPHAYFGGQYTNIKYPVTGLSSKVDGSSIGVVIGYVF